jgi:phenylpropionate dioxygenase-like ring-hydroxylating dioxygenase large terminal subunit
MTALETPVLTDQAPLGATIRTGIGATGPVTVPADRYTSAAFAEREHERLWPRVWQLACTLDHVAQPGDVFDYRLGDRSILVVRGDDGALRGFENVCMHRGSELCPGSTSGLTELRCGYHRWSWDLTGRLREVPSRKGFGVLPPDDYGLRAVEVDTWGPLVFVHPGPADAEHPGLAEFLGEVPGDIAWVGLDDFRCRYLVTIALAANWKTVIDGFSETYHVQGIHREMLPSVDDVDGPQQIWKHHGKLEQRYGLPSPRLRDRPDDDAVWHSFVEVMGDRIGIADKASAGPAPTVAPGSTLRDVLAERLRAHHEAKGLDFSAFDDDQLLTMSQYNLFPNVTMVVFPDLLSVVRSRPGATPDEGYMDVFVFDRVPAGEATVARTAPLDVTLPPDGELPIGLVLSQDVGNAERAQRGLHQPGFTRVTLSNEECRIWNLHRNLERWLDIAPSEITGL